MLLFMNANTILLSRYRVYFNLGTPNFRLPSFRKCYLVLPLHTLSKENQVQYLINTQICNTAQICQPVIGK